MPDGGIYYGNGLERYLMEVRLGGPAGRERERLGEDRESKVDLMESFDGFA